MIVYREIIAKKYAVALLNLYFDSLSEECMSEFMALEAFFRKNKEFLAYLNVATLDMKSREKMINLVLYKVFSHLSICCKTVKRLIILLLKHKRIDILQDVVRVLVKEFMRRKNIVQCTISVSHPIDKTEKKSIVDFFKKVTGSNVYALFKTDEFLISGIRMKSDFFLWEKSVDAELKRIKHNVLQRVF